MTKPWSLFVALLVLLFVGTLMPGSWKAQIESHFWDAVPWSGMAHLVLFAAIAAVPVYGMGRAGAVRAIFLAVLLAATTECLQSWVPGRHPLLRDALIDLSGALTGLALRSLWLARLRQLKVV